MATPNLQTHPKGPRQYVNQVWSRDTGEVIVVPKEDGTYSLEGNFLVSALGCESVKEGSVELAYRSSVPADVTATDTSVAGVLNDGSNNVGTISSYGPYFKFTLNPGLTLEDSSFITLTFTDTCGQTHAITIAQVFEDSGLDVTFEEIARRWRHYASFCPVDLCEQLMEVKICGETIATFNSNGGLVPQGDDWKNRISGVYFPSNCNACAQTQQDAVAMTFTPELTAEQANTLQLVAGTLRVPMSGCKQCCTYEWDFTGATFGANTTLEQIVVNGSEKLGSALPASGGIADLAALIVILNSFEMGTFVDAGSNVVRIEDSSYVWGDITTDVSGTDEVYTPTQDCPGCS